MLGLGLRLLYCNFCGCLATCKIKSSPVSSWIQSTSTSASLTIRYRRHRSVLGPSPRFQFFCAVKYFRYRSNNFPICFVWIYRWRFTWYIYIYNANSASSLFTERTGAFTRILSTKTDFLIMYTTSRVCFFIIVFYCAATYVPVFFSFNFVVAKV